MNKNIAGHGQGHLKAPPYLLAAIVFAVSLIPLAVTPVIPLIDYYNHVARYYILSHYGEVPSLLQSYRPAWNILPNIGLDVLSIPFLNALPPLFAAKCILAMIFLVQFTGINALSHALNKKLNSFTIIISGILLYSYIFTWGFANFLMASGLLFWGLAIWIWLRKRLIVAAPVGCACAIIIFFCHGFAFALYGLILASLEFGHWWQRSPRKIPDLLPAAAAVGVQAVIPAILFKMAPTSSAGEATDARLNKFAHTGRLLSRLLEHAEAQGMAILRVANSPSFLVDALSFVALALLIVVAFRKGALKINAIAVPALLALGALCFLTPPSLFGVGKIADRIPLVTLQLLAAATCTTAAWSGLQRKILPALAAIFAIKLAVIAFNFQQYQDDYKDFRAVARHIPAGAIASIAVPADLKKRNHAELRCDMYGPLITALFNVPSPLFAIPSQQPMQEIGELRVRADDQTVIRSAHPDFDPLLEPVFNYYITCNMPDIPADRFDVLSHKGRFSLIQTK